MYDELVKALRETDFGDVCVLCESELCRGKDCVIIQAADAIEELQKRVPKVPHGRLIDADAIPYNKIMIEDDDFYYGITQPRIERMPTIIPAEEGE